MSLIIVDPVAGPGLGNDEWCGPRRLQLGAQPPYVNAHVLGFRLVAAAPDSAQQVRAGQQLAPVQRQFAQQREFRGREVHDGPGAADLLPGEVDLYVADSRYGERPVWWLLWQRMRGSPSIVSILMRSGTVGSEAQRRVVRDQADLLFEPPLPQIGLRDWHKLDQAIAEGYAHAQMRIDQHGVPLSDLWTEGPAVSVRKTLQPAPVK